MSYIIGVLGAYDQKTNEAQVKQSNAEMKSYVHSILLTLVFLAKPSDRSCAGKNRSSKSENCLRTGTISPARNNSHLDEQVNTYNLLLNSSLFCFIFAFI